MSPLQPHGSSSSLADVAKEPDVPAQKKSPLPIIMLTLIIVFVVGMFLLLLMMRLALSGDAPSGAEGQEVVPGKTAEAMPGR